MLESELIYIAHRYSVAYICLYVWRLGMLDKDNYRIISTASGISPIKSAIIVSGMGFAGAIGKLFFGGICTFFKLKPFRTFIVAQVSWWLCVTVSEWEGVFQFLMRCRIYMTIWRWSLQVRSYIVQLQIVLNPIIGPAALYNKMNDLVFPTPSYSMLVNSCVTRVL